MEASKDLEKSNKSWIIEALEDADNTNYEMGWNKNKLFFDYKNILEAKGLEPTMEALKFIEETLGYKKGWAEVNFRILVS